ncbi:zeta toxin family protein [Peribacillus sp. N1]
MNHIKTTKDAYCIDDDYTKERKDVHKTIIDYFFNTAQNTKEPPQAILLGGGSASGKSTLTKFWIKAYEMNHIPLVCIDCDEIKLLIPDYENVKKYNEETAAFYVHDESSDIAEALLKRCIQEKKNLIYDGTMKNLNKYKRLVEYLIENEYNITVTVVDVPIEIAKERAEVRFLETGRRVPDGIIEESHREVPKTFVAIKEMVHEYTLYDTSGIEPIEIIEKTEEGKINVYDEKRLEQFYSKAELGLNI